MANGGFFAGGAAQGLTSGMQAGTQMFSAAAKLAQLKTARAAGAAEKDKAKAKFYEDLGPKLFEALQLPFETDGDKALRDATLGSIWSSVEEVEGAKVPALVQKFAKSNPQELLDMTESASAAGMTLGDMIQAAGQPKLASTLLLQHAQLGRKRRGAEAVAGGGAAAPVEAPAASDDPLAAIKQNLTRSVAAFNTQIERASMAGVKDTTINAMISSRDVIVKQLNELTATPALAETERRRAFVPPEVGSAAGVAPGTRFEGLPGYQAPAGAPTAPAVSGTAPRAVVPGEAPAIRTFETPEQRREGLRRSQPVSTLGERVGREAAQVGARTLGEWEDRQAAGARPLTQPEAERREKAALAGEELALANEKRWTTTAETAGDLRTAYSSMFRALQQAGPTGKLTDAIRQPLFQFAAVFGVKPERLANMEETRSLQIFLATQILKDFTGNDSDREFLAAIEKSPGLGKQPETNARLIRVGLNAARLSIERSQQAEAWRGKYGSTASKNADGFTYKQYWDAYRNLPQNRVLERPQGGWGKP